MLFIIEILDSNMLELDLELENQILSEQKPKKEKKEKPKKAPIRLTNTQKVLLFIKKFNKRVYKRRPH